MPEMSPRSEIKVRYMAEKPIVSVQGAADFLGVHPNTIRRWANDGTLQALWLPSGQRRFDLEKLEAIKSEMLGEVATDLDDSHLASGIKKLGEYSLGNITREQAAPEVTFRGRQPVINISKRTYDNLTQRS